MPVKLGFVVGQIIKTQYHDNLLVTRNLGSVSGQFIELGQGDHSLTAQSPDLLLSLLSDILSLWLPPHVWWLMNCLNLSTAISIADKQHCLGERATVKRCKASQQSLHLTSFPESFLPTTSTYTLAWTSWPTSTQSFRELGSRMFSVRQPS